MRLGNTKRTRRGKMGDVHGFRREVVRAFDFLRSDCGSQSVDSRDTFIRYENQIVFVNVYRGRSSFALRFEIGLMAAPESKYYPEEVAQFAGATESVFFQASTPGRVREYVQKLAEFLRRYGGTLLAGDATAFAELQEVRDRMATDVTNGYRLSAMRENAARAWNCRDYSGLVDALNGIGANRSPAEQRKLEYALSKLRRANR